MTNGHGGQHVVLSGCSGGRKSTLLAELASRGFETVEEPGRKIVQEELNGAGAALPWVDLEAFARRAIDMATGDRNRVASRLRRVGCSSIAGCWMRPSRWNMQADWRRPSPSRDTPASITKCF